MVKEVHFSLFRSASGPLRGSPAVTDTENEEPSTSGHYVSSTGAKSFTYGSRGRRTSSVVDNGSEAEELFALLQVADGTGTSPRLLKLITAALESNVERNEQEERLTSSTVGSQHMMPTGKLTVFHGLRPPPIGLQAYVERVAKYTKCSPVCFVMSMVYMDLLGQRDPDMLPSPLNVHRLLLSGVMLAAKLTDDHYFNNAFYGRVGGVSVQEMNRLELEMLRLLDYRLHVPWEELRAVLKQLVAGALVVGQPEGWSSSLRRKRRSVSGHSHSSEKRSSARRSSIDSSVGAVSASASATPSVSQSVYYDEEDDGCADDVITALQAVTSPSAPRR
ncbi:cyclin [Volvox carteri f. nagariensis]|uniref:Cyclin n=1 Tax=Volvox carteri f. nagariensis TaxID=3068 RepID=D8UD80_VOLCA|nr:cyclin [Volvox carteri f. nagariensis]EFJ42348.1 cyclin [Volvox carteri f. nagariensis]|eukprot:XP_002956581.1 cyclin [Volvox carteri f. nagariensis]